MPQAVLAFKKNGRDFAAADVEKNRGKCRFDKYDEPLFWLDDSMISQMIAAKESKLYFYTRYSEDSALYVWGCL